MDARPSSSAADSPGHVVDQETILAEARAWARRLRTQQPTTEDAAAFRLWRAQSPAHAHAWAATASDWRDIGRIAQAYRARYPAPVDRAAPERVMRPGRRLFLGSAMAAAGAAAVAVVVQPPLGLWPSLSELGADYRTATGEQKQVDLAGGIELALNTQTSLSVKAATEGEGTRVELLAGEAAVRNRGSAAMEVAAGAGRIWLASGCVEVRRFADHVRVLCTEGEAELRHPSRSVALHARQEVSYGREDVGPLAGVESPLASAWRQGVVVFNQTPLPEAVAEINRYRPGRVVLMGQGLAARRISGRFRVGALDEALVQMQQLYRLDARHVGGLVLLG
ncbi:MULTISPECIES: FecR family protein [Variovorax]|jgi:transmembrane sensor|uniref:FecR family protein n=1 Tax=Variovorax TaxID=34072 RepID=UPI00086B9E08|nr:MULTISPECIES: FecR domain-containing protein [Variovorax]MBN8752875.1 FecR domain-containing protein [Variovorax sp.]ODU16857.1 MAG: hypothetical protein ABS94_12065 [Variovorax sp. SCN 67-85]ODV25699.1 MAG: hypothetical protein ABT25_08755 [Variovorax sp. SCN 67-20]OJZ15271.1 MAG: hypothetical protein BGP22_20870 [Variovorax sp. 67-131]UKI08012.1 FecR domain-containing protein [Variovorax paradoxus]